MPSSSLKRPERKRREYRDGWPPKRWSNSGKGSVQSAHHVYFIYQYIIIHLGHFVSVSLEWHCVDFSLSQYTLHTMACEFGTQGGSALHSCKERRKSLLADIITCQKTKLLFCFFQVVSSLQLSDLHSVVL